MLWVKLYTPGARDEYPDGTSLDITVLEPTTLRVFVDKSSRREIRVGLDADKSVVKAFRSNAKCKEKK